MLRWRLLVSTIVIAALVGLGWLDYRSTVPGIWLAPALVLLVVLATKELLHLYAANGLRPWAPAVYAGTLVVLASPWIPVLCLVNRDLPGEPLSVAAPCHPASGEWTLYALVASVFVAIAGEMVRYRQPGRVTTDLAAAVFSIVYLGLLPSFLIRLRLDWGLGAVASLIVVAKMGDTGAYFFGKSFGRHKMSPRLSPNKTVEGAVGAVCFSLLAAWLIGWWSTPAVAQGAAAGGAAMAGRFWGWALFAVLIAGFGIFGDLAESLLKRDSQCKDSSVWVPGLGGVLDMLDSLLITAPVAYACWALGMLGR
jgi:phosphatidate cytidylyltransferase